jgi:hypothetical protein
VCEGQQGPESQDWGCGTVSRSGDATIANYRPAGIKAEFETREKMGSEEASMQREQGGRRSRPRQ